MGTSRHPDLRCAIDVKGERIRFDFAGTSRQVTGNINVTFNATQAAVCYTLKSLLDPDVPNNQGMLDIPEIVVEEGSLLNATFPAPVAARANTCQRIVDVIIGALAPALPDQAVGAANGANTTAVFSGIDPRTGSPTSIWRRWAAGSAAAPPRMEPTGCRCISPTPPICRWSRSRWNIRCWSRATAWSRIRRVRAGIAAAWACAAPFVRSITRCIFNGALERAVHQPWGIFGGGKGASGRFLLAGAGGRRCGNCRPSRTASPCDADQTIVIESPGAGGYGPAAERSREAIEA